MTQHPHAVADHGRRQHRTATDLRDLIREIFPRHHLGSRVVNKRTVLFKTMSGIYGRALDCDQSWRDSTAWNTVEDKQWKRLAHYMLYVRCAAFSDTLSREFVMLIPMGRSEDIRLALRRWEATRDEEQEEQCCECSGGSVGARKSLTERQSGNPVEEGAERLRPSTDCDPQGRQKCDVLQTMRDVWESVVAHSPDHGGKEPRDEAEQSHSACVRREATGRDQTPLLSTRTWERRDTVPLKVQGQLKGVDQEACLQLMYESAQRPDNQITALGLVS